jgi:hypothetical protein
MPCILSPAAASNVPMQYPTYQQQPAMHPCSTLHASSS